MLEGGRNEFPWFTFTHVPPWTPTTVSAGGLSTSLPSRLHLQSKTLGDENKRVCWRALEWFWQCLAALLDLSSSLACQFFLQFSIAAKALQWGADTASQGRRVWNWENMKVFIFHQNFHFAPSSSTETLNTKTQVESEQGFSSFTAQSCWSCLDSGGELWGDDTLNHPPIRASL